MIPGDENKGLPALKTILFWNGLFYYPDYAFGRGRQPFIDAKCAVNTCLATDDPYLLDSVDQYDAVMFHWPSLCDYPYVSSRSEHQLFVMVSDESPQVFLGKTQSIINAINHWNSTNFSGGFLDINFRFMKIFST